MATHSSILTWRIPWTEKPDGLQSIGSQRVRHTTGQITLSLLLSSRVQHDQILAFNYHILRHIYEI